MTSTTDMQTALLADGIAVIDESGTARLPGPERLASQR